MIPEREGGLKKRVSTILMARRVFALLITFLSLITIARLVSPRDYGLALMGGVILNLWQNLRDFGVTNAVLRRGMTLAKDMTAVFWCNCLIISSMSLFIAVSASAIAKFYGEPVVKPVILVALVGFAVGGLTLQHRALLTRDLRFGAIAAIDSAAQFIGFAISLGFAIAWQNGWAIVLGVLGQLIFGAVLTVRYSKWTPGWLRRPIELRPVMKFAMNTTIYAIGTFFSQNAATILIGNLLGAASLGQFNRAQAVAQIPIGNVVQPLSQAALPMLSHAYAQEREYRDSYLNLVRAMCTLLMPLSIILMFAATSLIVTLLGARWHDAGLVLSALSPGLIGTGLGYSASHLFVTQDRSAELRTLGLYDLALIVLGVIAGSRFGIVGAAVGVSFASVAGSLLRVHVSGRNGPISRMDQLKAGASGIPLAIGAAAACAGTAALLCSIPLGDAGRSAALISAGGVGALAFGLPINSSRAAVFQIAEAVGLAKLSQLILHFFAAR